ncbi:Nif11-like leader peptide family natural product precursor [Marinibaculum pumilum]|uniref:Nif11-like leader peptide family natural product n=1 Tax=Marinibaculum pumilum TaxID=1766165 RepID=A0ABV7L7E3_9PROT
MNHDAVEQFARDLRTDGALAAEVKRQASLDAVLEVARRHGFDITTASVVEYICRLAGGPVPTGMPEESDLLLHH